MRRPVAFISGSFSGGMGLAYILQLPSAAYISVLLISVGFVLYGHFSGGTSKSDFKIIKSSLSMLLIFMFLGMALFQISFEKVYDLEEMNGARDEVKGYGSAVEKPSEEMIRLTFVVTETVAMGRLQKPERILISVYDPDQTIDYGDLVGRTLAISGTFEKPSPARNPNCFDYRLYLKTLDIGMLFKTKAGDVDFYADEDAFDSVLHQFSNGLSNAKCGYARKLETVIAEENCALIQGMLFGDTNGIEEDTLLAFQKNSTAHILSVSGLHIGIIYMFMNMLAGGRKSIPFDLAMVIFFLVYAALSSFSPSVMRAVFMVTLHILSKHLYTRYDLLSATAFTAMVMLVANPMMLLNAGFQMSYLAMISLSVILPIAEKLSDFKVVGALSPILAIQVGMAPLICYHFNYFSLGGFIANIPVIFLSGFLIPMGICIMPLSLLPAGPVFGVGATAMEILCKLMVTINDGIYMDGRLSSNVISPTLTILILYYGLLFFLCSEGAAIMAERRMIKSIGYIVLTILVIALGSGAIKNSPLDKADLVFLDVGQGDCLFIETSSGKTMLVDGGGSVDYDTGVKTLLPFLLKNGYSKVDVALVTHLHQDHYGGIRTLSNEIEIGALCVYEGYQQKESAIISGSGFTSDKLMYLKQGDKIELDKGVVVEILYPEKKDTGTYDRLLSDEKNENDLSLIATVNFQGVKIMMTGDMDIKGEKKLMQSVASLKQLECDILKIGHHGSKYSTGDEFLKYCDPKMAVFQVGKNNFGHPHGSIIDKCLEKDIMVFRNDLHGAVGIGIENGDNQQIWVQSMLTGK